MNGDGPPLPDPAGHPLPGAAGHPLSGPAGHPVGRDHDLGLIRELVDEAMVSGGALLLSGDPGVGKTVLLDAAAEQAHGAGMRVVRAAGVEFESTITFAGLHQVLQPLLPGLDRLTDPHRTALSVALGLDQGAPSDQLLVSNAALTLLVQAAVERPLLVIVDDLPWLDRASAVVLGFVARRLGGSRVGFLGAFRSDEGSFFEGGGLPHHHVQPLDTTAAAALIQARSPSLAPRVRERLLAEAQGNPLALLELPLALSAPQRSGSGVPDLLPLSRRLQAVFASRVEALPAATRLFLLYAVLDGTGDLHVLASAGFERTGMEDLAIAERAGLVYVDEGTGRLAFRHPLTRSAVVELSTSGLRREVHRALAEQRADRPERRAWHLAHATVEPTEEVAVLLEELARDNVRRGDAGGAIAALLRAAELSPRGYERSRRIAEAAYLGADLTGDLRDVPRLLEEARLADGGRAGPLVAAVAAAHHILLSGEGDLDTAHRLLVGAIEMQHQPYDATDATMNDALYTLAWLCQNSQRPELWEPLHRALSLLKPEIPDQLALTLSTMADPARTAPPALGRLDQVITSLDQDADPVRVVRTAMASLYVDRLPGCRTALRRVLRDGRDNLMLTVEIQGLVYLGRDQFAAGEWDELETQAAQGRDLGEAHSYQLLSTEFLYQRALVAAARGDEKATRALTDEMTLWATPRGVSSYLSCASHARALAALGRGRFEDAYRHACAISRAGELASHVPPALFVIMDLVEAAVRTGRVEEAAAHAAAAREAGIAAISPRLAMLVNASAAIAAVDHPDAIELFEEALAEPGTERWPFERARVQLAYGERLRRAKSTTEARTRLGDAIDTFERLGALPWAARAGNELRATGLSLGAAAVTGPASLTPQQREIAMLAAAGLTNKQIAERLFLSPRTVAAHLRQLFPKLGVASRAALRDALADTPPE
ncbi:AAA family ATPase [Streptomyces sp. NBC_00878]|uniref:ATP-binding protein n=1 Tax=Streptomyces sp. NBC_00878 TaxID=2975854 RepID=UPI00224FE424|nr:AAA family ATPase [Streptomyces sp. NBC_00878]MCX4909298.1 AAA family ATPase [Streptomyces sp. NBC_00878]